MLLVILGAGASYDSAPSRRPNGPDDRQFDSRPPLANQLFGDRGFFGNILNKYPKCLDVAARLRHLPDGVSIETVLQGLQSESNEYPERLQQLASVRYYLQEILTSCTDQWGSDCHQLLNHRALLDDIRRWHRKGAKVCFVTFNYDTLLEYPLYHAGFPIASLSDYITHEFMLIKLHGSVNWGRYVETIIDWERMREREPLVRELIERYGELKISQKYVMTTNSSADNCAVFPALAIPVEEKVDFECPSDHVTALESFLPHVTKILVIGWRATEKPFLNMLKAGIVNSHIQVMVVNGSQKESDKATSNIVQLGLSADYSVLDGGFTDFILNNSGRTFLSA